MQDVGLWIKQKATFQRFSWALGVALATISGFIFCANNFLIQYYEIGALEILLVRSALQVGQQQHRRPNLTSE